MKKYVLSIGDKEYRAEVKDMTSDHALIEVNGQDYDVKITDMTRKDVAMTGVSQTPPPRPVVVREVGPLPPSKAAPVVDQEGVRAPLPGLIVDILVKENDAVKAGDNLVIMEAMKMENQVQAPYDGTVKRVVIKKGDTVAEAQLLVELCRPLMTTV